MRGEEGSLDEVSRGLSEIGGLESVVLKPAVCSETSSPSSGGISQRTRKKQGRSSSSLAVEQSGSEAKLRRFHLSTSISSSLHLSSSVFFRRPLPPSDGFRGPFPSQEILLYSHLFGSHPIHVDLSCSFNLLCSRRLPPRTSRQREMVNSHLREGEEA